MQLLIEDCTIHCEEQGKGEPLILLHGNGEDSSYFKHQISYFSKAYRVIAPDTRGHGLSGRGTASFTIAQFARDLHLILKKMNLKKVHLLGFSDGGNIALEFALEHEDMLSSLILNGANLNPGGVKAGVQIPTVWEYWKLGFKKDRHPEQRKRRELLALMVKEPHISPKQLAALSVPALVIAGDKDMIRDSHTRLIACALKNGKLAILPGSHFIAAEAPEEFNRAVEEFLRDVK